MRGFRFVAINALSLVLCAGIVYAETPARVAVEPPRPIRQVDLVDHDGRAVSFPKAGAVWRLVVFGYTNCPDVCPMTLHKTALLLKKLGAASKNVQVAFVSIDGMRDDAKAMRQFVQKFDPRIVGLSGDAEAQTIIANEFGVLTRRFQGKTALAYTLVHSSLIYLLDPAGTIRVLYSHNANVDMIANDLVNLVARPVRTGANH